MAGIHWWYKSRSHPAEMTAGYYNYYGHDGYAPIMKAVAQRDVWVAFTCIEMSDSENPDLRHCSPEGRVWRGVAVYCIGSSTIARQCFEHHAEVLNCRFCLTICGGSKVPIC